MAGDIVFGIRLKIDGKEAVGQLTATRAEIQNLAGSANAGASAFSRLGAELRNYVLGFASLVGTLRGARAIVDAADSVRAMSARLRIATADASDFARAQAGVYEIANRYGSSVDETARSFARLNPVVRQMGGTSAETLKMLDGLAASLKLSGATAAETSAVLLQFSQAMGSGKVAGDELRSMMENAEPLMRAVAAQMGKTTGDLRMMAEQGQLTSAAFGNALLPAIAKLSAQAEDIPLGLSQSIQILRNELSRAFGREFEGQATALSRAVRDLAGYADTAARAVRVLSDAVVELGKAATAVLAGAAIGAFLGALTRASSIIAGIGSALSSVNTVLLGIVAGAAMQRLERLSAMGKGGLLGAVFFGVYEFTDWILNLTRLREKIDDLLEPVFRRTDKLFGIDRSESQRTVVGKIKGPDGTPLDASPKRLADPAAFARLTQDLAYETRLRARHKQELLDLEQAYQDRLATLKDAAQRAAFAREYQQARQELIIRQTNEIASIGSRQLAQAIAQARLDAARAANEGELALLKEQLERAKNAYDAALEDRLVSIRGYYAAKTLIDQREIDAEIERTRTQLADQQRLVASARTEADRIKAKGEVAGLEKQLMALNERRAEAEMQNARAAAKAERELADAIAEARDKLLEITQSATDADIRASIERQYRDLRKRAAAEPDQSGLAIVDRLIEAQTAQARFDAIQQAMNRRQEIVQATESSLQSRVIIGLETEATARQKLRQTIGEQGRALEQELLPKIQALMEVTSDPKRRAELQAVTDKIREMIETGRDKSWLEGVQSGLKDYATAVTDAFQTAKDAVVRAFESMENALVEFVTTGKLNFRSLVNSILADIARLAIQRNITQPIAQTLGTVLPSVFASEKHTGGIVGADSGHRRALPAILFAGAPRLHAGGVLAPGEVPAILRRGEGVFTPEQMRALGAARVVVNVHNNASGTEARVSERNDNGVRVVDVVIDQVTAALGRDIARGAGLAPLIERRYGLSAAASAVR